MNEEGISKLPGPILHHILSFLDDKKAFQTCVVSKSWRHLVSTRPKFSLSECDFKRDNEKFRNVLDKSLQVYYDQKLCIEAFSVSCEYTNDPELVSLLQKWIPIVTQDLGVKKFDLSFGTQNSAYFDLPAAVVFESKSLQELYLDQCKLSQIKSIGKNKLKRLKTLHLYDVYFEEEESFAKFMSSCPLIEDFSLVNFKGLTAIKMHNNNNDIYLFSHRIYLPSLTCLVLQFVPLSNEWFDSFSRNFPCLEDLNLSHCSGFDELKLSSRSVKNLDIYLDKSTIKATFDAPSIKMFSCYAPKMSQSISFTATTSNEWKSKIRLELDENVSQWFLKISELVAAFSQSQIISLVLWDYDLSGCVRGKQHNFEHLSDFPVCHEIMPAAIGVLELDLVGHYKESFFSDLVNGLFRIFRPREIEVPFVVNGNARDEEKHHAAAVELLCKILFAGKSDDQATFCWQRAGLAEISLIVFDRGDKECHLVQGTRSCSEYVAALLKKLGSHKLRIQFKWSGGNY